MSQSLQNCSGSMYIVEAMSARKLSMSNDENQMLHEVHAQQNHHVISIKKTLLVHASQDNSFRLHWALQWTEMR